MKMVTNSEVEVVISGIGGYFPKSKNVQELQKLLFENHDILDTARWKLDQLDVVGLTGNVENLDLFDASYFGIHRHQSAFMDPMCRMLLQNTFEALVDAGVNPMQVRGKNIGVFIASTISENDSFIFENVENGFGVTGQARTMIANRISYWLNVTGPSYSCDDSWVGGLQALKSAYEAVKTRQCDGAIVGGVNAAMNIYPQYAFKQCGFLSPDGKTKTFDENADGYGRSDGFCVFYLLPIHDARRCYASLINVEVEYNGAREGDFSTLDVNSFGNFLTNFYQHANVPVSKVDYIEAYGSGLKSVDEFELNVIDRVFRPTTKTPILVGSVKSIMGHTEAASCLLGITKTIIAMETGVIPANLNYNGNKNIAALRDGRIQVISENKPWSGTYAAINGIGLSSSYGHALLKRTINETNHSIINEGEINEKFPYLYTFSSRTEEAVRNILEQIKSHPTENFEYMSMINDIFITHIPGHLYRGYIIRNTEIKIREEVMHYSGVHRPIWFVYSGMGSQWCTMGKDLLRLPIFAETIQRCHETLKPYGVDLYHIITENDITIFDNILNSFVGIAAIQIALTDLLSAMGIKPDNIIGHSVGELGCAYADGCLTAEQMILAAYYRGRASLEVDLEPGLMAAVGVGASVMKHQVSEDVDIACHNGPESCTLSGPQDIMRDLVAKLKTKGIFARLVNVAGIAYHSRYIKPAAPLLLNYLKQIIPDPKPRSDKWYSTSVPESSWDTEQAKYVSPEYLTNNLLSSVYFEEVLKFVPRNAIVIEVAPHGLLQAILRRSLHSNCINIPLTKRGEQQELEFFLSAVGKLYLAGMQMNISSLYQNFSKDNKIVPCSRGTPSLAPLVLWAHNEKWRTGISEFRDFSENEKTYQLTVDSEIFCDLIGCRIHGILTPNNNVNIDGTIVIPVTSYLLCVLDILNNIHSMALFENIFVRRSRIIPEEANTYIPPVNIMILRGTGSFEINDRYGVIATGKISIPNDFEAIVSEFTPPLNYSLGRKVNDLKNEEFYREISCWGHEFHGAFRAIHQVSLFERGMTARIEWTTGWPVFLAVMTQLCLFRIGQISRRAFEIGYINSIAGNFNKEVIPESGTLLDVVYNYASDTISSSIIIIKGLHYKTCQMQKNNLIGYNCYSNFSQQIKRIDKIQNTSAIININDSDFSSFNIKAVWLIELKEILKLEIHKYVYLFSRIIPTAGIENLLEFVRSLPNGQSVRLVFVLDKNAPNFINISDSFYRSVLEENDAFVHVYFKGKWEHKKCVTLQPSEVCLSNDYSHVLTDQYIKYALNDRFSKYGSFQNFIKFVSNIDIHCLGINPFNLVIQENRTANEKLGILDYSGIDLTTNQRVMGLSFINDSMQLSVDPILQWSMPEYWSFVDGATVPFAYVLGYYMLNELAELLPGDTILIHNGSTNIGLALIQIAFERGCMIYTSVANERQKAVLLSRLNMLTEEQIFDYTSPNLEQKIMSATEGRGINVIINCLLGERLRATLRCASELCRVVLLQDENNETDDYYESIGLSAFLRCTGIFGVRPSQLCKLPEATRKVLYECVLNGLRKNEIIPLRRNVFREKLRPQKKLQHIIRFLTGPHVSGAAILPIKDNSINVNKIKNSDNNKGNGKYIIYGDTDIEKLITTVHWLTHSYHASNVTIIFPQSKLTTININYMNRFLLTLQNDKPSLNIEVHEPPKNEKDIQIILQKIIKNKNYSTDGAIILTEKSKIQDNFVAELLNKIPSIKIIYSLMNTTTNNNISLERYTKNNETNISYVRFDKNCRFSDVVHFFAEALKKTVDIHAHTKGISDNTDAVNFSFRDFFAHLSSSIQSLKRWSPPSLLVIKQSTSASPRVITDCPPVFVVPGIFGSDCKYLKSTLKQIYAPTFILDTLYDGTPFDILVMRFAEEVRKVYPKGPYNIIGVSTGGALAIELAKYLENDVAATVQLFLIDGVPNTIKQFLEDANSATKMANGYEIILLEHLLRIKDPNILAKISSAPSNWAARLTIALSYVNDKSNCLHRSMQSIKQHLEAFINYIPNERVFNGATLLLRPNDSTKDYSFSLQNYLKQMKKEVIKGNHFTMLQTNNLVEYINNDIIIPQMYG